MNPLLLRMFERFSQRHVSGTDPTSWRLLSPFPLLIAMVIAFTCALRALTATDDKPGDKSNVPEVSAQADKPLAKAAQSDPVTDEEEDDEPIEPGGVVRREDHEVTISGRAVNEEGEPIAGARIFVVRVTPMGAAIDDRPLLAEGKVDADGRYRFQQVKLPVLEFAPTAVPKPREALFQVFGIAEGYGYVWRRTTAYRPTSREAGSNAIKLADEKKTKSRSNSINPPNKGDENGDHDIDLKSVFFADEPIVLDLKFSPEVRLHGTVRDDLGNPLNNAVVQVGLVSSGRASCPSFSLTIP